MTMTSDAKRALSTTIRGLRARLLEDLHAATEATYRLSVSAGDAELPEAAAVKRQRLQTWIDEQVRSQAGSKTHRTANDFRREVEKQAAYTLLNRLVILRLMESAGLRSPRVVTGGWESPAYKTFRELAPELVRGDETEGFAFLLSLVFEDLATDLPGLYGTAGVADLVPVPTATLRHVVESLDDAELETCWSDDMTAGWVYQYWNDPEREALDAKVKAGAKIEPHEIASKTQMFTERYMVDWLLQNSLGPMWLATCKKHGWTPEVEADGTLARLEERRVEWRSKRDHGEVSRTELMPLRTDTERRWAYYVPQPIPDDAVDHAPESVRDLKVLDPAVGPGHFLVVAFDLLVALYREESRHRGEQDRHQKWSERAIVERILEQNLHGIDLDPRAVQIAAAALWLKARQTCRDAHPQRLNLVASNLRLASLPDDDPALVELRRQVERETGIPAELTDTVVHALKGADHLGSLLKVDTAVEEAIRQYELTLFNGGPTTQRLLFGDSEARQRSLTFDRAEARVNMLDRLERFLVEHTGGGDLGLRLRGEQLAAGVRFVRLIHEDTYDIVVGNPPYQGIGKVHDMVSYQRQYPSGRTDLYAGFFLRASELLRASGMTAMISLSNWMSQSDYRELRRALLAHRLEKLADLGKAAFTTGGTLIATSCTVLRKGRDVETVSLAVQPNAADEIVRDDQQPRRTEAALLLQRRRFEFDTADFACIKGNPVLYSWSRERIRQYAATPKMGEKSPARATEGLYNNSRFTRWWHEVVWKDVALRLSQNTGNCHWVPFTNGSDGAGWIEPLRLAADWQRCGIGPKVYKTVKTGSDAFSFANERFFFADGGVAFAGIGKQFTARVHRYRGLFGNMGRSVFASNPAQTVCLMNSKFAHDTMSSLNPSHHFEVGDVNRLPLISIDGAETIFSTIDRAFSEHESHREASVEFRCPGPSPWRHAQEWAQAAVDRAEGEPLRPYQPVYDPELPSDHISFALGLALGRFGTNGEGILDPTNDDLTHALPAGILFLDGTLDDNDLRDGLGQPAVQPLLLAWNKHRTAIDAEGNLRDYLRTAFFEDAHRKMYENRPIHWPLSSEKKTFVAWINIHRWNENTLRLLLADHLKPTLVRLEGELNDIRTARDSADKKAAREAEKRLPKAQKCREELAAFIAAVEQCAEKGPPPVDGKCPAREVDARYVPDLDDGVMINSAALWPVLAPQWKDPKKWWKELATSQGKKDYDWAHLAMRYWPTRVDAKCRQDPSLGVAHGCFWKCHPARAWAWELRLQDEIGPDFRIEEPPYRGDAGDAEYRDAYLLQRVDEALETIEKEVLRRRRKQKKAQPELQILERGLWSSVPEKCWDLELRVIRKQGDDFRLVAPDEPQAREKYESEFPDRLSERKELLASLAPQLDFLGDGDDEVPTEEQDEDDAEQPDDVEVET